MRRRDDSPGGGAAQQGAAVRSSPGGVAAQRRNDARGSPAGGGAAHASGFGARWPRTCCTALLALLASACAEPAPTVTWEALPGAEPLPEVTTTALAAAWQQRDPAEALRTRHRRADGSAKYVNRLLLEASPYLRQHANNPVNWYPWGDEAFDAARRLGRPVLLSIGYSTCHWCHVMEDESFEDEEIARFLNEHYVAIKVDREQRPDLDSIYMTAVQAIAGRGGWPMTVWLTPDREPFHAGTYFPARDGDRRGMPGFLTVLAQVADAYRTDHEGVSARAAELAARVRRVLSPAHPPAADGLPGDSVLDAALAASLRRFDADNGGTRGAPKFPSSLPLRALLRHHRRSGSLDAIAIAARTLEGIARGGIRDHLGGGFHRYSTDPAWVVPHFEKMLYDNALLAVAYIEAWQVLGRAEFADAARETLAWVEREMTSPDGGFFAATDADSAAPDGRRVEGVFFTWTPPETAAVLGEPASGRFDEVYGVTPAGNIDGRSVLHLAAPPPAAESADTPAEPPVAASLAPSRELLLEARRRRPPPLRDDKIITSWNALMISAAAKAALAFGDDRYRRLGARAADFLLRDFERDGRLSRSALGERRQPEAFLDDYAFLEAALLDLYEAGDGDRRLEQALALDAVLEREFEDAAGGFFLTPAGHDRLLAREKPRRDGAEPSGNSVAILNLLRLAELTGEQRYRDRAERALAALADLFARDPLAAGEALVAVDFASDSPKEIVLVSAGGRDDLRPLLEVLGSTFVPNRIVITLTAESDVSRRLPLAEGKLAIDGQPTAYVCEARVCELPARDPALLATQLRRARPLQTTPP